VRVLTGTSGFSYKEWKGSFYPADLPNDRMLAHYAERLPAVEINNTFYRMPKRDVMRRWAEQVPDAFKFVIKASRRITHQARLVDTEETLGYLWRSTDELGAHLGPILFQLPPFLRKDLPRLRAFLATLPAQRRAVFEFRHESWVDDDVHDALRDAGCALCIADTGDPDPPQLVPTTDWGYLRMRRPAYSDDDLDSLADRIAAQPWNETFVFFKHEADSAGPELAHRFQSRFE
jgi:uncharacterized protein YecE (DUF72 family)